MEFCRKSLLTARSHFYGWKKDYRVWLVFLMEGFLVVSKLSGITAYAVRTGTECTVFVLPMMFTDSTFAEGLWKILIYFGFILLVCNAPFRDGRIHYMVIRSGKAAWWGGSILYIAASALIYLLFLALLGTLTVLPAGTLRRYWGSALYALQASGMGNSVGQLPAENVMNTLVPAAAEWMTFGIAWLSLIGIGFLVYLVNDLSGGMMAGSIAAAVLVMLDPTVNWLAFSVYRKFWYYLSPVSWTSIEHWDILAKNLPLNGRTVTLLSLIIAAVLGGMTWFVNQKSEVIREEQL